LDYRNYIHLNTYFDRLRIEGELEKDDYEKLRPEFDAVVSKVSYLEKTDQFSYGNYLINTFGCLNNARGKKKLVHKKSLLITKIYV